MSRSDSRYAELAPDWLAQLGEAGWREMADDVIVERGRAYFEQGKARLVRDGGGNASFKVKGSARSAYDVELYFDEDQLHVDCNCPHAQDGNICKHMVAAGLQWADSLGGLNSKQNTASALIDSASNAIKNIATGSPAAKRQATAAAKRQALLDFLHAQDAASLVQKLLDAADDDRALMAELKSWQAQAALSAQLAEQAHEAKSGQAAKTTKARNAAWREPLAELLKKRADFYHWSNIGTYIRSAGPRGLRLCDGALVCRSRAYRRLQRQYGGRDAGGGGAALRLFAQSTAVAPRSQGMDAGLV